MFTDTKNMSYMTRQEPPCNTYRVKSKRKIWKPLLRLLSPKSAAGNGNATPKAHPNNINLNNAANVQEICELSTHMLEDYAAVIRKVAAKEACSHDEATATCVTSESTDEPNKVICSASIEKTPTNNCCGCIHGRNCQHLHPHNPRLPVIEPPTLDDLLDVPVHYMRTDDGTFFWTSLQDRIDDDLLSAWLCQSFGQFPAQAALR